MQRVLVCGATGFIGRNLVELLARDQGQLFAFDVAEGGWFSGVQWLDRQFRVAAS